MKTNLNSPLFLLICLLSCTQKQNDIAQIHSGPKVVEAKGYIVPRDSMIAPTVIVIDENKLKKIQAGKPLQVKANANIFPAGKPKVVRAGNPRVCSPGQDSFLLPEIIAVIDSPFVAGFPEVVIAKDSDTKDQNPQNFSSLGKLQGLKNNWINCIREDKSGNLWLGYTGGATRYDGKFFSHFTKNEGLLNSHVSSILEDSYGNLWIGTTGGVSRFDGKYFTNFTTNEDFAVYSIFEDKLGNIWFGTEGGLYKYDGIGRASVDQRGNIKKPVQFLTHYTIRQGLSHDFVLSIAEDKTGNLWFGTEGGGVNKFDGTSFMHFTTNTGLSNNIVRSILEDRTGNLWFATSGGVTKYDGTNFYHLTTIEGLSHNEVISILEDQSGNFWFGTLEDACKYEPARTGQLGTFTHYTEKEGLPRHPIWNIFEDKSGNIWLCSDGGLNKFSGKTFTHFTTDEGLSHNSVRSILEDKTGNLWLGTLYGGVMKYDGKVFSHYTMKEGLSDDIVFSILEDQKGNLWFGTHTGGVCKFDGYSFTHFTMKTGLPDWYVACILEDHQGNLWFGTNHGVCRYDGKSLTTFTEKEGLSSNIVRSIEEDQSGNLWFGTVNKGVTKYQPPSNGQAATFTHFAEEHGFPDNEVESTLEDHLGNMWFGTTNSGVTRYQPPTENKEAQFTILAETHGLSDLYVRSILEDHSGNLWFGTAFGLNKLPKKYASKISNEIPTASVTNVDVFLKNYSYEDGFLGIGCNRNALFEDRNGTIWIGTNDRLTAYHPEGDIPDTIPPNMQLTGISMFSERIPWPQLQNNKDSTLTLGNGVKITNIKFDSTSKWYGLPQNLSLRHDNNYLTFNYIGITQKSPKKVKYQYKLEGNDENWSSLTPLNEAHYGNLSHGHYTFKVKAMNSEGFWSDEFHYPFTIRPPWWLTWWAYCLYALGTITLLWRLHKYQQARTIRIERERTQARELEQAKEIEKAYTQLETAHENLKSTQAQLIQSEKMASLGQVTAGIAHEIQNPLNFINNFSEVNEELLTEMKDEMDKGNMDEAKTIANDAIENQQKILFHGKRADAIVKGMLQHSRTSSGVKEPTDINALCDEYLRLAYHGLRAKDKNFNATMKTDFDESIGMINVIPQDIGRVILNLITNAFYAVSEKAKQIPTGYEPIVIVKTKRVVPPSGGKGGQEVEISVSDNGPGIPQHLLDKIFQPFFTTKPTGQGTGLGLSLSYDIIKAHGGDITVQTTEGIGSEFIIQLPYSNM